MTRRPAFLWFSQIFENDWTDGLLLAVPYEGLAHWDSSDDRYDEIASQEENFVLVKLGPTAGLFIGEDDGVHEAHWMRLSADEPLMLVVWSAWNNAFRSDLSDKQFARAWREQRDPRQQWLQEALRTHLDWHPHTITQSIPSGMLFLMHGNSKAWKAKLAKPDSLVKCGETVPVGLNPGNYRIQTTVINELPDGNRLCLVCRWIRVN
ncbi:hypothetical protein SH661x_001249 [Planctomicrobium sp. SH661]|uniref:hypothetical protein n=1 Tax=Planctomicrobium sp. SH661 TaxID=3448124 RepID=UPI003F5BB1E3